MKIVPDYSRGTSSRWPRQWNAFLVEVPSAHAQDADRSVLAKKVMGTNATYTGSFTAIFDASGKNLAPSGTKSVTLNEKTGRLVKFE